MEKSKIAKIVTVVFIILIIVGVVGIIRLPYIFDLVKGDSIEKFSEHTLFYKIAFYCSYLIGLFILYKLYDTFNYLYKVSPFTSKIEKNLKIIAISFMFLFAIIVVKAFFIPTPLTFGVIVICFVVSLCFYLLAEIIKKGIIYKDEVDSMV